MVVFTDLDGTLLDHRTYSWEASRPALRLLEEKNIPLIVCSSKTAAEIKSLQKRLNLTHPFISENGAAIFIPRGYFRFTFKADGETDDFLVLELGTPYRRLRDFLARLQEKYAGKIKGFGDLSVEEVSGLANLPLEEARLAKMRDYDEPFLLNEATLEPAILEEAQASGLQITRGSRFYHLLGKNDKGKAVEMLTNFFRQQEGELTTIGVGDSLNDLPMLEAVDYPVLVQKPDLSYDPGIKLPHLILASKPGPEGFSESVSRLIKMLT